MPPPPPFMIFFLSLPSWETLTGGPGGQIVRGRKRKEKPLFGKIVGVKAV